MSKISVVIPTYKGSDKILLPLYGVFSQTCTDIEIIVVDDNGAGSDEQKKTQQVLQPFIDQNKLRYIVHEKNINGSAARNTGWRASEGEFISFLDDDDLMLPEKLEKQLAVMEADERVDVAICGSHLVHEDGRGRSVCPSCRTDHMQKEYLCGDMFFNTSVMLLRRAAVEAVGGFDETFRRHQDWEFCIRLMEKAKFAAVDEVLLVKYATGRNVAADPWKAVEYYRHFRGKMEECFTKLAREDVLAIDKAQHQRLLKTFLIARDFTGSAQYMRQEKLSSGLMLRVCVDILHHIFVRATKGNRKRAQSWDENMTTAKIYFEKEADR